MSLIAVLMVAALAAEPVDLANWKPGQGDFTIALRAHDATGELIRAYDATARRGFHVTVRTSDIVTSVANDRQLQFGIDDNRQSEWEDRGRPGNALFAFALATFDGHLYAGTCEPEKDEAGHVYRYAGGQKWIDLGSPDRSNSVTALAAFDGSLYAATGKYRVAGSALRESENLTLGGRVFRLDANGKWVDCGQIPNAEAVGGMTVYRGKLYATSLYRPAGCYRYAGGTTWEDVGTPGNRRVNALTVFQDRLFATSYDGGDIYEYDGTEWKHRGRLGENTQTYSFAEYDGKLYVGTWPSGRVYRLENDAWVDTGRLGEELEVMGMIVHNGRLIAGTLPLAEVYQFERDGRWTKLTRLDHTPDVRYRRAWAMAEFDGRAFVSTLPSGKIYAWRAGTQTTWDRRFPMGEHRIVAVRRGDELELYVDGRRVAQSTGAKGIDIGTAPVKVAKGVAATFYDRALTAAEIADLPK